MGRTHFVHTYAICTFIGQETMVSAYFMSMRINKTHNLVVFSLYSH